jgi:hypothetical protein
MNTPHVIWTSRKAAQSGAVLPWKESTSEACPHGLRIMLVDGTYVRDTWDSDFSQGGNGWAYGFVPKNEIWIDWCIPEEEWPFIVYHECVEVEAMRRGFTYSQAHEKAKRQEDCLRHPKNLKRAGPWPKLARRERELASRYIPEEIETRKYPRKQAVAIGISRARAAAKKECTRHRKRVS